MVIIYINNTQSKLITFSSLKLLSGVWRVMLSNWKWYCNNFSWSTYCPLSGCFITVLCSTTIVWLLVASWNNHLFCDLFGRYIFVRSCHDSIGKVSFFFCFVVVFFKASFFLFSFIILWTGRYQRFWTSDTDTSYF